MLPVAALPARDTVFSEEARQDLHFQVQSRRTLGGMAALALLFSVQQMIFSPTQVDSPNAAIIPPQFAKLVLTKPKTQTKTASGSSSAKNKLAPALAKRARRLAKAINGGRLGRRRTFSKSNLHASLPARTTRAPRTLSESRRPATCAKSWARSPRRTHERRRIEVARSAAAAVAPVPQAMLAAAATV